MKKLIFSIALLMIIQCIAMYSLNTQEVAAVDSITEPTSIDVASATDLLTALNDNTSLIINITGDIVIDSTTGNKSIYLAKKATTTGRIINGNGFSITFNGSASGSTTSNIAFYISDYSNMTINDLTIINSANSSSPLCVYRSTNIILNNVTIEKIHSDTLSGVALVNNASQIIIKGNLTLTVPLKSWGGINLGGASTTVGNATLHFDVGSDFIYDVSTVEKDKWPIPIYADGSSTTLYNVTSASDNVTISRESMTSIKSNAFVPSRTVRIKNEEELKVALQHPLIVNIVLDTNIITTTPVEFSAAITITTQTATQTQPTTRTFVRSLSIDGNIHSITITSPLTLSSAFSITSDNVTLSNMTLVDTSNASNVLEISNSTNVLLDNVTIKAPMGISGSGIAILSSSVSIQNDLIINVPTGATSAIYLDTGDTLESSLTFSTNSNLIFDSSYNVPIINANKVASQSIAIASYSDNIIITELDNDFNIDLPNNTYTVTFTSDSDSLIESQTIVHGNTVTVPTTPLKKGYTFSGWYTELTDGTEWDFNTNTVTGNIILYARWTVISDIAVSFNTQTAGSITNPSNITVTLDSSYGMLPTVARTGYTFDGWYTEAIGGILVTSATIVTNDTAHTIHARWTASPITLSGIVASDILRVGESFTIIPSYDGRTGANGWVWDKEYFTAAFNSPATFTALKAGTSTISFTAANEQTISVQVTIEGVDNIVADSDNTNTQDDNPTGNIIVNNNTQISNTTSTITPQTGEYSNISLWLVLLMIDFISILLLVNNRKYKKYIK